MVKLGDFVLSLLSEGRRSTYSSSYGKNSCQILESFICRYLIDRYLCMADGRGLDFHKNVFSEKIEDHKISLWFSL